MKDLDIPPFNPRGLNSGRPFPKPITLKKEPKRIARQSVKRKHQNAEYLKVSKKFLSENPFCEVFPQLKATEVHHRAGRIGPLLTDTRYFSAVSRQGHVFIHENVAWAKSKNFIINRFQRT